MDGYLISIKIKMDTLHRENKLFILLFIICFSFFTACNGHKEYNTKEVAKIRERAIATSQSIIGKETYYSIYQMANDSILNWSENKLGLWKYYGNLTDYQLDSVFCVNEAENKIVFSILRRSLGTNSVGDGISYFYGVKIRNTWYFFQGPFMFLPREFYQKDIHTPLSFEKLKQIATKNIYQGYLEWGKNGQWEINERFFDQVVPVSNLKFGNILRTEEEYVRFMVEVNWSSDVNETIRKYQEEGYDTSER